MPGWRAQSQSNHVVALAILYPDSCLPFGQEDKDGAGYIKVQRDHSLGFSWFSLGNVLESLPSACYDSSPPTV